MSVIVDYPEMFCEKLKTGINLFTGAGFSTLPAPDGTVLPVASELCTEICCMFSIPTDYKNDLEKISTIANLRYGQRFQNYLRNKYTVDSYNPLYDNLNKINIKSYITTNIDNIIQCVMDCSKKYSLHNIVEYGAAKKASTIIPFIPLHGNVRDITSHLYFGKNELANVDSDNKELFDTMHATILSAPTLFWGYGFHDNAVERIIAKSLEKRRQDFWIQCRPENPNIQYFRDLGCHIIIGTTEELLIWINDNLQCDYDDNSVDYIDTLSQYGIPSLNEIETVSHHDFFVSGITHWYCVLSNYAYETKWVSELYENSLCNKNIIAVGIPYSGKTTLMMLLAAKMTADIKLILSEMTVEEAQRIINVLNGRNAVIFIDNCCDDADLTLMFMREANIRVVGFSNDYTYESSKHLFDEVIYSRIEIDELSLNDAQGIFSIIPEKIRSDRLKYKFDPTEKYSMFELMSQNVTGILSKERIISILIKIKKTSYDAFQTIAITTYLVHNKSTLSTDVLCAYFQPDDYSEIEDTLSIVQGFLHEIDVNFVQDLVDQDYYSMRSNLFANLAYDVLLKEFKCDFSKIVKQFIMNVSPYIIYHNYIFRRSAYDARLFFSLFGPNAHQLYQRIYNYDGSAYTLQQWSLYKAYLKDYAEAFSDIDKAINMQPNNFSIKNSRAIILFEANKFGETELAEDGLSTAMATLQQCFTSDKRKVYHAQKYAEFALFLAKNRGNNSYLPQAKSWLEQILANNESSSRILKAYLKEINTLILTSYG